MCRHSDTTSELHSSDGKVRDRGTRRGGGEERREAKSRKYTKSALGNPTKRRTVQTVRPRMKTVLNRKAEDIDFKRNPDQTKNSQNAQDR